MWNSVWNLGNPLQKRTICSRKFRVMSVYLILKFLSGLKGLKREGKRLETISAPVIPARQKQKLTSKKSVKLFDKIVASAFEQLLSWLTLTRKLFDRFYITISTWKKCVHRWCRDSSFLIKRKFEWTFVLTFFKHWKRHKSFREHNNLWWIMVFSIRPRK